MKRLFIVILSIFALMFVSCKQDIPADKQEDIVSRMEREVSSINIVWMAKHVLKDLSSENTSLAKDKEYVANWTSIWKKNTKEATARLDSLKKDFQSMGKYNTESHNELVALYGNLEKYYNIAVNPNNHVQYTTIYADDLRLELEQAISEYRLKHNLNK